MAGIVLGVAKANNIALAPSDVRALLISTTQSPTDQSPSIATATAGATTVTATGYGRTDNNFFAVAYAGAAGTTLTTLKIDLSQVGIHFDASVALPTDASATATATGVVVSAFNGTATPAGTTAPSVTGYTLGTGAAGTANSLLTVTFSNFNPGATLRFGIGRRNDVTNVFGQLADPLGGQTAGSPKATIAATTSANATTTGPFANAFKQNWNYKTGYGLISAQGAVSLLLGTAH